jgi:hypothetical protein
MVGKKLSSSSKIRFYSLPLGRTAEISSMRDQNFFHLLFHSFCRAIIAHGALGADLTFCLTTFTCTFLHIYMTGWTLSVIHKKWGG